MVSRDHHRWWLSDGRYSRSARTEMSVLDDYDKGLEEERISRWLDGDDVIGWKVQEGLDKQWESLEGIEPYRPENGQNTTPKGRPWTCSFQTIENVTVE